MRKIKKVCGCIFVTLAIWVIVRFVPSLVSMIAPTSTMLKAFALITMLPIGWLSAKAISKERFAGCIRVNLYIFAFIEVTGILDTVTYLWQNLAFYTGRYITDANGIAYSDYPLIFGGAILFEIAYIALCVYFAKKTVATTREERAPLITEGSSNPVDTATETTNASVEEPVERDNNTEEKLPSAVMTKQRYCKYCGGAIDGETKICTKCGKQYFRIKIKKRVVLTVVALVSIVGLAALNVCQYSSYQKQIADLGNENTTLQTEITELQTEIFNLERAESKQATVISSLNKSIDGLKEENSMLHLKIGFYDEYVVFVSDDGTGLYHKFGCSDFDKTSFWAFNTAAAVSRGYHPCPKCCE